VELFEAEEDSLTRLSPRDSNYIAISSLQAKIDYDRILYKRQQLPSNGSI